MNKLKIARTNAKLTQKIVAEKINVTAATLSRYESGDIQPDPNTLKKLSLIYNVSVDFLLGLEPEPTQKEKAIDETMALYNQLPEQDKEKVKAFIQFVATHKE